VRFQLSLKSSGFGAEDQCCS